MQILIATALPAPAAQSRREKTRFYLFIFWVWGGAATVSDKQLGSCAAEKVKYAALSVK